MTSFAQKKFSIVVQGDLFSIPFADPTVDSVPPVYSATGHAETNIAFYGEFIYWPHPKFGIYTGAGIHTYNFNAQFEIPDPVFEGEFVFDEYRKLYALAWSPTIGLAYRTKKLMGKIGLVAFDPFKTENSAESSSVTNIFFGGNQTGATKIIDIDEEIRIFYDAAAYEMIQASFQYEVATNFYLHAGIEFTTGPYGIYHYRLYIKDISLDNPSISTVANDFRITSKYKALTLGVTYIVGFGKYKPKPSIE